MTELIWDGKYVDGKRQAPVRVALPFQTIETVNEAAADRQRSLELFARGGQSEWRNRLIWGDKKYVLPSLLPEFAGKVNLVYIDPPFDTGADFSFNATVPTNPGVSEDEVFTFTKEPSIIEHKAYRDTWGRGLDSYLQWFNETVVLIHELLTESGSLYVHLDYHVSHYAKVVLDEVFGNQNCRNEIVWKRQTAHSDPKRYGPIHDVLFYYGKSPAAKFNMQYAPYDQTYLESHYSLRDPDGRQYQLGDLTARGPRPGLQYTFHGVNPPPGRVWTMLPDKMEQLYKAGRVVFTKGGMPRRKRYLDEMPGVPLQDVWTDINPVNSQALEATEYATQKPEALLERVLKASSTEGDLVLDCFAGSGTTAAVAERLGRRWIVCDLGRFAVHTARKRLLSISGVKPFAVQNLGKYERQVWQTAEFSMESAGAVTRQRLSDAAYREFIIELYHARPINGYTWLHGLKSGRMVHVGAVDAPVTIADVKAIAREVPLSADDPNVKTFRYEGFDIINLQKIVERDYTIPEPQTAQEVLGYYSRRIAEAVKLPSQFAALAPKVREFFEHKVFGQTVDLTEHEVVKAMSTPIAHYVCVDVFSKALKKLTIAEQEPTLLEPERKLSSCQPFPWSRPVWEGVRTVFNLVPCDNHFERDFAKFLDNAPDVAAYAKLPQPFGFSIDYTDGAMNLRSYYPDFAAVDTHGTRWLIETKGAEYDDVAHKDVAAARWCENATQLAGTKWQYLKVPQKAFETLQPSRLEHLLALRASNLF